MSQTTFVTSIFNKYDTRGMKSATILAQNTAKI